MLLLAKDTLLVRSADDDYDPLRGHAGMEPFSGVCAGTRFFHRESTNPANMTERNTQRLLPESCGLHENLSLREDLLVAVEVSGVRRKSSSQQWDMLQMLVPSFIVRELHWNATVKQFFCRHSRVLLGFD